MNTKIPTSKVRSKTIKARDMVEDLHVFIEKINLAIAQDPLFTLDSEVKYSRAELGSGVSHLFQFGAQAISIDFQTQDEGGAL